MKSTANKPPSAAIVICQGSAEDSSEDTVVPDFASEVGEGDGCLFTGAVVVATTVGAALGVRDGKCVGADGTRVGATVGCADRINTAALLVILAFANTRLRVPTVDWNDLEQRLQALVVFASNCAIVFDAVVTATALVIASTADAASAYRNASIMNTIA